MKKTKGTNKRGVDQSKKNKMVLKTKQTKITITKYTLQYQTNQSKQAMK